MNKINKNKLEKKVLEKIKSQKVKMKPEWEFRAEKVGLGGTVGLLMLLGAILLAIIIFIVDFRSLIELVNYGRDGRMMLVGEFPFGFLGIWLGVLVSSVLIIGKTGDNYKKRKRVRLLLAAGIIAAAALILLLLRKWLELELMFRFW